MEHQRGKPAEAAFTLTELMVVVVIIGLLALIAIPALTRDSSKSNYTKLISELQQTLQRAKIEAVSSREPRQVTFNSTTSYELQAFLPGTATVAQLKLISVPPETEIYGYVLDSTTASCSTATTGVPGAIAFSAVSNVTVGGTPHSITLCVQSKDGQHRGRVTVTKTTAYSGIREGW
jgi:prepilin-type N-terminal cleavage/methylation domain-containing protein